MVTADSVKKIAGMELFSSLPLHHLFKANASLYSFLLCQHVSV